jgi:uncharacterized protein (TIGR02594 family)
MNVKRYKHLEQQNLPRIISIGVSLLGTVEDKTSKSNHVILEWAKECKIPYNDDAIPWCGLFTAVVVQRSGRQYITNPLWARNWAKWGLKSKQASLGDVLVFVRNGGGHVGFYIAEDSECYHVLGGNQSDAVTITRIKKNRCIAARKPVYNKRPITAIPYVVLPTGDISTNEA